MIQLVNHTKKILVIGYKLYDKIRKTAELVPEEPFEVSAEDWEAIEASPKASAFIEKYGVQVVNTEPAPAVEVEDAPKPKPSGGRKKKSEPEPKRSGGRKKKSEPEPETVDEQPTEDESF